MQWILQAFDDTRKLADVLDRLEFPYTWHDVVPFVGELRPEPVVPDPNAVVMFGSYSLWRYAEAHGYKPGVFRLAPFVHETVWRPHLLNGSDATLIELSGVPEKLPADDREWFLRPVEDTKALAGDVKSGAEIVRMADKVLALDVDDIPDGSLRHDTLLMISKPRRILREWRVWIVNGDVVTFSLYREGSRVVYRHGIDDDALRFASDMARANPDYSPAYVMDVCRTPDGLRLIETNCINAAGFYAADLQALATAVKGLG